MCHIIDLHRKIPEILQPIITDESEVEVVSTYELQLDNKLKWTENMDAVYKKAQSSMYFLRRLTSFRVCSKLLQMF